MWGIGDGEERGRSYQGRSCVAPLELALALLSAAEDDSAGAIFLEVEISSSRFTP